MDIRQVTPREAHELLEQDPGAIYLDVRTEGEFEGGHPAGARNVPVVLVDPVARQPVPNPDFVAIVKRHIGSDTRLLVGCQSGGRSQHACELLARAGYTDLSNVWGGFGGARDQTGRVVPGWAAAGLPVEEGQTSGRCYTDLKSK